MERLTTLFMMYLASQDSNLDKTQEIMQGNIDMTSLNPGKHMIFVRGQEEFDAEGGKVIFLGNYATGVLSLIFSCNTSPNRDIPSIILSGVAIEKLIRMVLCPPPLG